jgi:alpha-N-acetylglucosamine transferase
MFPCLIQTEIIFPYTRYHYDKILYSLIETYIGDIPLQSSWTHDNAIPYLNQVHIC